LFLLIALLASAALSGRFYRDIFSLQIGLYALALLAWFFDRLRIHLPKPLLAPYYFCAIHLAALVGVGQALHMADETHTWEKVR
jgi:hypothetical protein